MKSPRLIKGRIKSKRPDQTVFTVYYNTSSTLYNKLINKTNNKSRNIHSSTTENHHGDGVLFYPVDSYSYFQII